MPEHTMIDVPEVDFMAVTENVRDWRIGKRVEIVRPKLSLTWGCGAILALPVVGLIVAGLIGGNLASYATSLGTVGLLCGGLFALVVIPFNLSNRERKTVFDWTDRTIQIRHGLRTETFRFDDIQRLCVQTTKRNGEPVEYDGVVEIEITGRRFPIFETLTADEDSNKPCEILISVARRLADEWGVPCEAYFLGNRVDEAELQSHGLSAGEIATKYQSLGSISSGYAMSADFRGDSDKAEEHRQEAIFYYMEAHKYDPNLSEPLLAVGRLSNDEAHREMAINAALKLNPDSVPALLEQGRQLCMMGQEDEGLAALTRAIEIDPSVTTYQARANANSLMDRYEPAYADYTAAIQLDADDAENYASRAACLKDWANDTSDSRLLEQALEDYAAAIRLDDQDHTYRTELGATLVEMGRYDEGIAELTAAVKADPESFYPLSQRGEAYLESGRNIKLAERDFSQVVALLESQPRTTDATMQSVQLKCIANAYFSRAEARRKLGRMEQADADEQRANELIAEAIA